MRRGGGSEFAKIEFDFKHVLKISSRAYMFDSTFIIGANKAGGGLYV